MEKVCGLDFYCTRLEILRFSCNFAAATVPISPFGEKIKRESGENPEQSRCCKLFNASNNSQATG